MFGDDFSYPRALFISLLAVVFATLLIAAGTSSASLGAYNPAWDGTAEIRSAAEADGTEVLIGQNVTAYQGVNPNQTVAVILSPTTAYEEDEIEAITKFVEAGGTLLVADDYGTHSNSLLSAIGAEARITGTPLRDEQRAGPSPAFPRAETVSNHTFTEGVDEVMLNHGSTVEPANASVLIQSSEFSYLDTNRNQQLDDTEELAQRPVVTTESVGSGTVLVVSDPSIFINSMLDRSDNAAFLGAIIETHDTALLDISHNSSPPLLVSIQLALQQSGLAVFVLGTVSVLGVALLAQPLNIRERLSERPTASSQSPSLSREDAATAIRKQHPEWDTERVERVTDSLMAHREKRDTNE